MIMFTLLLPVAVMLMGLAIDRTMLFIVEARLSAAVDGAALGAGRLLGTAANTTEIAGEFLRANFPSGYWNSYNLTPHISYSTALAVHTIRVAATVDVPLMFLRVFNQQTATVGAQATATRRDSRIVLVLDRSGSMSGDISYLRAGATDLVNHYWPPNDQLGLVVFGSAGFVAYPDQPRPYNTTIPCPDLNHCGPDANFSDGTTHDLLHQITNMQAGGATNLPESIELAYVELQKAYQRDVAANGSDNRLNAIVLFTDGMPTAMSAYVNAPTAIPGDVVSAAACTYKTLGANPPRSQMMIGGLGTNGTGNPSSDKTFGLFQLASQGDTNSVATWLANTTDYNTKINPATPITNCPNLNNTRDGTDLNDLSKIPMYDLYNTSTDKRVGDGTNGYYQSYLYKTYGNAFTHTPSSNGYQLALAAWSATDNAGYNIRTQTTMNPIYILTIGYTDQVDAELLRRLANDPSATSYDATQLKGQYYYAGTNTDIAAAFKSVASALLRLAQ